MLDSGQSTQTLLIGIHPQFSQLLSMKLHDLVNAGIFGQIEPELLLQDSAGSLAAARGVRSVTSVGERTLEQIDHLKSAAR
jgi:hypothetical protein